MDVISIRILAEANRHCRDHLCEGCPFINDIELCENRKQLTVELFIEVLDMIGFEKRSN